MPVAECKVADVSDRCHLLYCRNNTLYTYTNTSTQIKDGIYGTLTNGASKYITTNGGAAGDQPAPGHFLWFTD